MSKFTLKIDNANETQIIKLLNDLNSIKNITASRLNYVHESFEFADSSAVLSTIVIQIITNDVVRDFILDLIVKTIMNFFEKNDNEKPIIINYYIENFNTCGDFVQIIQGENKGQIEQKVKTILTENKNNLPPVQN